MKRSRGNCQTIAAHPFGSLMFLAVLINIYVDWEMCIDVSHLVSEALGDTDDQVVDECAHSSEGSDVLSGTVVQFDVDDILLWVGEVDCQMLEVLGELACSTVTFPSPIHNFLD